MSKYKFFPISDESKEAIKIFNSPNLTSAYSSAASLKKLSVERFKKLFTVEKIK
tara:strand:+ start:3142 stop:3303 length:162 start_codon:yes stop_codon:yes gene_type:complete